MGKFPRPLNTSVPDKVDNPARRPGKHIPQVNAVDVNKHPTGNYACRISFSKLLLGFLFSFVLWGTVLNAQPVLGPAYDCTTLKRVGVYTSPVSPVCKTVGMTKIIHLTGKVSKYRQVVRNIRLYNCITERVTLKCREKFFGAELRTINTQELYTSPNECLKAINTKQSTYGPIKHIKGAIWVSQSSVSYNCQWLHTVKRVFTKITIFTYMGELVDSNPVIHQDVTNSICNYKYRFCRPIERAKSILTWNYRPLSISVFHNLGFFNATKIDNYILIAKLGIGVSIIRNVSGTYLLDIGYLVSRINIRGKAKVSRQF